MQHGLSCALNSAQFVVCCRC